VDGEVDYASERADRLQEPSGRRPDRVHRLSANLKRRGRGGAQIREDYL
jgi:hypothetical protein